MLFLSRLLSSPFVSCPPSVTMKRCLKCVSNQKHCTGNLQSHQGRCEMCSPCRFCGTVPHFPAALACQIPPPSHCSDSNASDFCEKVPRKPRNADRRTPAALAAGCIYKHKPHLSSITTAEFLSTFMGLKQICGGSGADLFVFLSFI